MQDVLDLVRFPLDRLDDPAGHALVARCREDLRRFGLFDMDGLVRPAALRRALAEVAPLLEAQPVRPPRRRPVYPDVPAGLSAGHPALRETENTGLTVAGERLGDCLLSRLYRWPPLADFLARVLGGHGFQPRAGGMTASRHAAGEAAGWRFSRSAFKVRLLLQAPQFGGSFEYVRDLRSDDDANPEGVAALLAGQLPAASERLMPGTLNVLRGGNTAQRVTTVAGTKPRIIAEFAFAEGALPTARECLTMGAAAG